MDIVLKITGMHCGGCSTAVRNVLSKVESVKSVAVDLATGRATISADRSVDDASLIAAVEDAGYEAEVERS